MTDEKSVKKFPIQYQRIKVRVPLDEPIKTGQCEACLRRVGKDIKTTHIHHHKYAYRATTVKKNPKLALENTSELCYSCHLIGNCLMTLFRRKMENMCMILDIAELMPEDMMRKMDVLSRDWLKRREKKPLNTTKKDMY